LKQLSIGFGVLCALFVGGACGRAPTSSQASEVDTFSTPVLGEHPIRNNPNATLGIPHLKSRQDEILISRSSYVLSFAPARRGVHWAAWHLSAKDLGSVGRSNSYKVDEELDAYLEPLGSRAVRSSEYKGSCYDRGHQVPSGDRTQSVAMNRETFLMSNMMPQTPFLNQVIWQHLEVYERELARQGKDLYIAAGGIFNARKEAIGPEQDIAVPDEYFKIIADVTGGRDPELLIAVIMPNINSNGFYGADDAAGRCGDEANDDLESLAKASGVDWRSYTTSLEKVEHRAGMSWSFLN
jgi:DNA/RNA endonuclease G (NUC1)